MAQLREEKINKEWSNFADSEPATVAPGSFIPQFPARKRKYKIDDGL